MQLVKQMMNGVEDVRYVSDAATLTGGESVTFPVTVVARKPTFDAALQAVREVLQNLQSEADALALGGVELEAHHVRCQLEQKGGVLVELAGGLVVKWAPEAAGFWHRAEGVAWCLDLIQRYCELTKPGSDVAFYTARLGGGRETAEYRPKGA